MKYGVLIALLAVTACESSGPNLQRVTASQAGANVSPDQVMVSNVDRRWLQGDVTWDATVSGKAYKCSADDNVLSSHCVRVR